MCGIVAVATLRELVMHALRMRQPVTSAALRNHLVLVRMTGNTGDLVMLGRAGRQQSESGVMARGAQAGAGIRTIGQLERFMSLVTGCTVVLNHRFGVRRMTFDTVRDITVAISVAEVTGHFGVHTGADRHLLAWTAVTGLTNRPDFAL